ncbi:GNAT family protein [Actimicrobium antarcticum]|uniref:GNAT family protein n=1 Tax=Actimicrobium antarcticum TaxID=1051899 RepID=A0ABP7TWC9_9BURK
MSLVFPVLNTERLTLREIVPADADALFRMHSDADTMRWFGVDPITSHMQASQLAALFASWFGAGTGLRWGLARHGCDDLVGTSGFFRWNKSWHSCLLGFELSAPLQGCGYMTEAVRAILDHGFRSMDLHRIQAESHPDNAASIALLTRLGFRFEGVHREQARWGGQFHDLNCYALLRQEWPV